MFLISSLIIFILSYLLCHTDHLIYTDIERRALPHYTSTSPSATAAHFHLSTRHGHIHSHSFDHAYSIEYWHAHGHAHWYSQGAYIALRPKPATAGGAHGPEKRPFSLNQHPVVRPRSRGWIRHARGSRLDLRAPVYLQVGAR